MTEWYVIMTLGEYTFEMHGVFNTKEEADRVAAAVRQSIRNTDIVVEISSYS